MSETSSKVRQIGNGLRILKIGSPQEIDLLARDDLVFDALETGPAIEDFVPFARFSSRIKALWHCSSPSAKGLEQLDHLEAITAHHAWRGFDFRELKQLKSLCCDDVSAVPAKFLNHPGLEVLDCGEGKVESMALLRDATSLRHLRLNACKVKSLDGIQSMQHLLELRLSEARALSDIEGLAACTTLQCLEIEPARKLGDVEALRALHALRVLYVSAPSAQLRDLDWIEQAPALRCAFIDVPLERVDWARIAAHPTIYSLSVRIPAAGMKDTEADITRLFEAGGRRIKEVTRYTKVVQVELEPAAHTREAMPLSHYLHGFRNLPPD